MLALLLGEANPLYSNSSKRTDGKIESNTRLKGLEDILRNTQCLGETAKHYILTLSSNEKGCACVSVCI